MTENPSYVLATTSKNTPTYLNCHVSMNITDQFEEDFKKATFYNINKPEDVNETDDEDFDDQDGSRNEAEVLEKYNKQYENNLHKRNQTSYVIPPLQPRTKRDVAASGLSFEWLHDDKSVITLGFNTNKIVNSDGFTLFPNGTLKFQATNTTGGEYRCKVKYTKSGKSHFEIGPMISRATLVEVASKFEVALMFEEKRIKNLGLKKV